VSSRQAGAVLIGTGLCPSRIVGDDGDQSYQSGQYRQNMILHRILMKVSWAAIL
jgi:hypothetical protein